MYIYTAYNWGRKEKTGHRDFPPEEPDGRKPFISGHFGAKGRTLTSYQYQRPFVANHANYDTNAPHLASRGAFWHRVGCKLPWRGVHLAEGRGALWRRWGAFPEGGVHQGISLSTRSITSASEEALAIINEKQLKMCSLECITNCDLVRKTTERSNPVRSDCKLVRRLSDHRRGPGEHRRI